MELIILSETTSINKGIVAKFGDWNVRMDYQIADGETKPAVIGVNAHTDTGKQFNFNIDVASQSTSISFYQGEMDTVLLDGIKGKIAAILAD